MQQRYLGLFALALVACGGGNSAGEVKTPDQILAEQEALGDEQLKKQRNNNDYIDTSESTEEEKKRIPEQLLVWLRYRSEKYFGEHRTAPGSPRK